AKARGVLVSKGMNTVANELSQRLISAYINKLGYYAIQLYSGQISLDDMLPTQQLTEASQTDRAETVANDATMEPLRFLVVGQVSSGKSSLINALFGDIKSAESFLPSTSEITPYCLERDGLHQAIILDSAGYGGLQHPEAPAALLREWAHVDIILMVCNATQAARQADAVQLDKLRRYFQQQRPHQALPVIIAVATQIDRLRPLREWQPPYNIQHPDTTKAQSIRLACEAIAQELQLPLTDIIPVCLAPEKPAYNIEDGLMPRLFDYLDKAQRVRYLRCLRHQQNQSYWQQWRKQAVQAGQLIVDIVAK
ncbi:MAG: 50S ribosome-binding GTPase, partial [Methylovulum sp.]|nr:50S ribosome-binding GTPase [Methylovulum sp.]